MHRTMFCAENEILHVINNCNFDCHHKLAKINFPKIFLAVRYQEYIILGLYYVLLTV